jgi:hypothetical protein
MVTVAAALVTFFHPNPRSLKVRKLLIATLLRDMRLAVQRSQLMRKLLVAAAIVAAALLAAGAAHAESPGFNFQPTGAGNAFKFQLEPTGPSFNCNYAKTPDEVAICQTPERSRLDRKWRDSTLRR